MAPFGICPSIRSVRRYPTDSAKTEYKLLTSLHPEGMRLISLLGEEMETERGGGEFAKQGKEA